MTNADTTIRALIIYAVVVPLALVLGYLVATPTDLSTVATVGLVLLTISVPLILRWHYPLLFLSWNTMVVCFFLPGRPQLWLVMAFLSLLIAVVQRALLSEMRFLHVPSVVWPLLFLGVVVAATLKLRGGMGLNMFGSDMIGGKRYIIIFGGIAGFLAMVTRRIPPQKVPLYVGLFFLGELASIVSSLAPLLPSSLYFLFLMFPVEDSGLNIINQEVTTSAMDAWARPFGTSAASLAVCYYLLARYGIRGLLSGRPPWRLALFLAMGIVSLFGGFRSLLILLVMAMFFLFCFEGLLRSRYALIMLLVSILGGAALIPLAPKLPTSMQRSLSFLPLDVDAAARADARSSTEWRLEMWRSLVPEIPNYLLLGKGLAMDSKQYAFVDARNTASRGGDQAQMALLAGDYHSGPLSLIIPFGIFGVLAFVWFLVAAWRALYFNYRYGDPAFQRVNTFLFALFLARVINFLLVAGGFYSDITHFTGLLGLSLALNGGIHKPVTVSAEFKPIPIRVRPPPHPAPGLSR